MDVYSPDLATMKTDLIEKNKTAEVFESDFDGEIFIFIRKDFLDIVSSPEWGRRGG